MPLHVTGMTLLLAAQRRSEVRCWTTDALAGSLSRVTVRLGSIAGAGRRQHVPLGGIIKLGATQNASDILRNETPSAGAEGVRDVRNASVGAALRRRRDTLRSEHLRPGSIRPHPFPQQAEPTMEVAQ